MQAVKRRQEGRFSWSANFYQFKQFCNFNDKNDFFNYYLSMLSFLPFFNLSFDKKKYRRVFFGMRGSGARLQFFLTCIKARSAKRGLRQEKAYQLVSNTPE